jgi:hypothetical protein
MQQTKTQSLTSGFIYFVAWILCSVILIANVLVLRQATLDVMTAIQGQQIESSAVGEKTATRLQTGFVIETIDRAMIIIGGIVAVALSLYTEYYFRKGRQLGLLWPRIGRVLAISAAVFVIGVLIVMLV